MSDFIVLKFGLSINKNPRILLNIELKSIIGPLLGKLFEAIYTISDTIDKKRRFMF